MYVSIVTYPNQLFIQTNIFFTVISTLSYLNVYFSDQAINTSTVPSITCLHTGQSLTLSPQSWHVQKCLHTENRVPILPVRQILHVMSF